jgi:hypothetical protein
VFPFLAERMPGFAEKGEHVKEHQEIHEGLVEYASYIRKCGRDAQEWEPDELKRIMDSFQGVLFRHMDHEVESLRGEELKKVFLLIYCIREMLIVVLEVGRTTTAAVLMLYGY